MDAMADVAVSTHLSFTTLALRLLAAVLLGSVIGIDREWRSRPAGLRTHMLTSLAAALFTILTIEIVNSNLLLPENSRGDPIRIIEAVTAGVAFLAAGTIIRGESGVRGLTTGAGMWLAGALGVGAGLGQFSIAILAAFLGLIVISLLGWAEKSMQSRKGTSED
jgi:putative Mg2+ transporter-C (MgtC) family protein